MKMLRCLLIFALPLPLLAMLEPPKRKDGALEIVTTAQLLPTLTALRDLYLHDHPGMDIRIDAVGSDVAMAWLYTGRADIAVIGREATDSEIKAYGWVFRHKPAAQRLMRGSATSSGYSPDLAVRVNAANPLAAITLDGLTLALRPASSPPTWSRLGVEGAMAADAVDLTLPDAESGTGRYIRKTLLAGATQYDWRRTREMTDTPSTGPVADPLDRRIADEVAKDTRAIGLGDAAAYPGTRIIPVLAGGRLYWPGQPDYPLSRDVVAYSDPEAGQTVAAWLSFVRGHAAQAVIAQGPYRPADP